MIRGSGLILCVCAVFVCVYKITTPFRWHGFFFFTVL